MALAGDPFFKIKPGNLERAGLEAVAATDALLLIDDHWSRRQLGDGFYRTNPRAGGFYAVLAGPVRIGFHGTVFGVNEQIDHDPVVGSKIYLPIGDQFISFHFQFVPPFACGHATLAADASSRVNEFPISLCLPLSYANGAERRINGGTGQKPQEPSPVYF
jgi:hypothetical protein